MGNKITRAKVETEELLRLQESISGYLRQRDRCKNDILSRQNELQELTDVNQTLVAQIEQNDSIIKQQNQSIEKLKKINVQNQQKNKKQKNELNDIQTKNKTLKQSLSVLKIKSAQLEKNKPKAKEQIRKLNVFLLKIQEQINQIGTNIGGIDKEYENKRNSLQECQRKLKRFNNQLSQTQQTLKSVSSKQLEIKQIAQNSQYDRIEIILTLENSQVKRLTFSNVLTVSHLKRFIYRYYDELTPPLFILLYNQKKLNEDQKLLDSFIDYNLKIVQLKQRKAQVWELPGIKFDQNIADQVSTEKGVAFIKCGHYFSRSGMAMTIEYQLHTLKESFLACPFLKKDGTICGQKIDLQLCRLIAGYNNRQFNLVGQKISQNRILQTCFQCPRCCSRIQKTGIQSNRVKCPLCSTFFCFQCSEEWPQRHKQRCLSQSCNTIRKMIAQAPWDREFPMFNRFNKEKKFPVKVPNLRACPKCKKMIKNSDRCKHTTCLCGAEFCFVCLSIKQEQWGCGAPYQYCGNVAPNQTLVSLRAQTVK